MKEYYVYILSSFNKNVLYIGVTSDLVKRIWEHKNKIVEGFSKKYDCDRLVYYEIYDNIDLAIKREKQLKAGSRIKKENLINDFNSEWLDLYDGILN